MPRTAGSPNKNKAFLLNRLQDMYGEDFHPIMKMAENAVRIQAKAFEIDDALSGDLDEDMKASDYVAMLAQHGRALSSALDAWDKVAQYTEPKLKAIEHSTVDGGVEVIHRIERVIVEPTDTNG